MRLALPVAIGLLVVGSLAIVVIQGSGWLIAASPSSGPGVAVGTRSPGATPPLTGPTAGVAPSQTVLDDSFDLWPVHSPPARGWIASGPDATSALVVPLPTSVDRSVRLDATAGGQVVVCKAFVGQSGRLLLQATMRFDATRGAEGIAELRAGTTPLVRVGLGAGGTFVVSRAGNMATAGARYESGAWYQFSALLDAASRTYDWEVRSQDGATQLAAGAGERWALGPERADAVCFVTRGGAEGASLYVAGVTVSE